MRNPRKDPGLIVSASAHAALVGALVVGFAHAPKYEDAPEPIPVETVTAEAFSQIAKGEKQAREAKPQQRAEKIADKQEIKPRPPTPDAVKDVPIPPPPFRRMEEPALTDAPKSEPQRVAALPPPRPPQLTPEPKVEPKAEPPKPPEKPVVEKKPAAPAHVPPLPAPRKIELAQPQSKTPEKPERPDAEPVEPPKPQARPKVDPNKVERKPEAKASEAKLEPKKPESKKPEPVRAAPPEKEQDYSNGVAPRADKPALKLDAVAALLNGQKADKPAAAQRSGAPSQEKRSSLDLSAVSKLIDKDRPQQSASTGREATRTAALGTTNGAAPKMSPNMAAAFDSWIMERYAACWSYFGAARDRKYLPEVRVVYRADGSLSGEPQLINPTSDPALTSLSQAALSAVRKCNPLRIPAQFQPYYEQWKVRRIRFDPEEMG